MAMNFGNRFDIATETLKVGNALASVKLDRMIVNLAKGIAYGQYELDKVGVDITKLMGVPGIVSIGDDRLSMLEAGFIPSFYHFVDSIIELKMEVNIREEDNRGLATRIATSTKVTTDFNAEVSGKAGGGFGPFTAESAFKSSFGVKSTSAYSKAVDATYSQKFSQDLSATSLMRTKITPVPAPEVLIERIKIILEKLREQAEDESRNEDGTLNKEKLSEALMSKIKEKIITGAERMVEGILPSS